MSTITSYEYSSFYKPSMHNNFALTQGRNALIVTMNIPRSVSNHAKQFRPHSKEKRANSYFEYSSFYQPSMQNSFPLTQCRNALIVIMNIPRSMS